MGNTAAKERLMLINEFLQWAAITVLGIFVLGLVRQLGHHVVTRRDHLLYLGPAIDKTLPMGLLDGIDVAELQGRIRSSPTQLGLVVAMSDRCVGCRGMVAQLGTFGAPADTPLVALLDSDDTDYIAYVEELFTNTIADPSGTRAKAAGIIATPFVIAVDGDLRVRHRGISGGLHDLLAEWTNNPAIRIHAADDETPDFARPQGSVVKLEEARNV
jgi:hypothetical protein